jgi:hypothetical protein
MSTEIIIIVFFLVVTVSVIVWMLYNNNAEQRNANKIKAAYENKRESDNGSPVNMKSINPNDKDYQYKLLDYYICSSYNSCCIGDFLNDYVSMDILKTVIKQGVRVIDLEIYMVDNKPVVAVSPFATGIVKGSYNSLSLLGSNGVLDVINRYAFSLNGCDNPKDPLFINFRIKCDKLDYNALHSEIISKFKNKLLGPEYSYGGRSTTKVPHTPLNQLMGKVIIMCNQKSLAYRDTKFNEVVNMSSASNSQDFRVLRLSDAQNQRENDYEGLEDENKSILTMLIPDLSVQNSNIDIAAFHNHGVQMVAMNYQNIDANMQNAYDFFNKEKGSAFVLKPERLRLVVKQLENPDKQKILNKPKIKKTEWGQSIQT